MTHRTRPRIKSGQVWSHKTVNRRIQIVQKGKRDSFKCHVLDKVGRVKIHDVKSRDLYAYYQLEK